jgi:hypothetical protein
MKVFFTTLAFVSTLMSFAETDLSSLKQKANYKIDQRMNELKEARNCISTATTMDKYRSCNFDLTEEVQMQKMEMKETKKETKKMIE